MTESDNTKYSSGSPKPQWLIDFEAESRKSGDKAREQLRAELGDNVAKGKEWPAPARGSFEIHLFEGAWVRLWHEPHSMAGRIKGLRRVADDGPLALLMDFGNRGLHAARPADGSEWTPDIADDAIATDSPQTEITVWLGFADADVIPSPGSDRPVETWTMRTAPRLEVL